MPGQRARAAATATGVEQTEVFPLLMFAVGGMLMFPAANDLLTCSSRSRCCRCRCTCCAGWPAAAGCCAGGGAQVLPARRVLLGVLPVRHRAALRLRRHGATSAASPRPSAPTRATRRLLLVGTALVAVGLLFKVGAVPFHAWTPDVYQGAPTPITGFMAACTKVAAFGALLRLFYVGLGGLALGLASR